MAHFTDRDHGDKRGWKDLVLPVDAHIRKVEEQNRRAEPQGRSRLQPSGEFDALAIVPGESQSLQMDRGLAAAGAGVVVLTPSCLAGRFWTERELGALLHKETLIPVLHGVTFADVAEYSGILPDLAGFTTSLDSVPKIAAKIAGAVAVGE